jgi:DNA repair protein RecO (recombination protein O)
MPLEQSEAYILRTFNVGEQDKIVVSFSKNKGIIKGIAKGARKFGNRFGSSLEPLSLVKLHYYEKEHKDLVVLNNCDLIESYFELQQDIETAFMLSYFSELIEEFSPSRSQDDILFRLLSSVLDALRGGGDRETVGAYFEAWILKSNGSLPNFTNCRRCRLEIVGSAWLSARMDGVYCDKCAFQKKDEVPPGMDKFLDWIKKNPPPHNQESVLFNKILKRIRSVLQSIIIYHIEKEPKSLKFVK